MTARRRGLYLAAFAAAAAGWIVAEQALWQSTVPGSLHLPHVDPHRFFSSAFLHRAHSFDEFLAIDVLLGALVQIAVLVIYARRGHRFMRESAAGPIGTGMLLGMLGLGLVWIAQLPFGVAELWWERRHHLAHQGYPAYILTNFLGLGGVFLFVSLALAIVMGLAKVLRQRWWIAGAPVFVGLTALFSFVSPYLIPATHPLRDPSLAADARQLARAEGVPGTRVYVERVHRETSAPNAEAVGFGPTRRIVLWDTLFDGRFSRREVRVVIAHELGHHAHGHIPKDIGWAALFAVPAALAIAFATRRRGGMARPEAVPVALLVLVGLQLAVTPLQNIQVRHIEQEADWSALQTTRDPAATRGLFVHLATASLSDPDPPAWSYVLLDDHPTIAQRLAMAQAWQPPNGRP